VDSTKEKQPTIIALDVQNCRNIIRDVMVGEQLDDRLLEIETIGSINEQTYVETLLRMEIPKANCH